MKKRILTLAGAVLLTTALQAQNYRAFVGTPKLSEVALDNKAMPDGGVVIVGYSTALDEKRNYNYKETDLLIARLDAKGNLMWSHVLGHGNGLEDKFRAVAVTEKGNVVAVGSVGQVPWTQGAPSSPGWAAAYCFDGSTGAEIWRRHVHNDNGQSDQQGDSYTDVAIKKDGNVVAVGCRDNRPGYSDGLATLFDGGTGSVMQSQAIMQSESSDALGYVTTDGDRIFVNGFYIGNSYYDLTVMELDGNALTPVWSRQYDYSFVLNTADDVTTVVRSQWPGKIAYFDKRLIMMTYNGPTYNAGAGGVTGFVSVSADDGSAAICTRANHDVLPHQNNPSVYFTGLRNAFTTANPANTVVSFLDPDINGGTIAVNSAYLTEVDPSSTSAPTAARRLLRPGKSQQGITSVHGQRGALHYCGVSNGDGAQIGADDIFYVRSITGVPGTLSEECIARDVKMNRERREIKEGDIEIRTEEKFKEDDEELKESERLESVVICERKPCSIDAASYSVDVSNPFTYTFNSSVTPAGSAVTLYVNGSPIVSGFGGLTYTFPSSGYYWVCLQLIGEDGRPCAEKCFGVCISDERRSESSTQRQSRSTPGADGLQIGSPYPNPTSGELNVPVNAPAGKADVRITTIDGRSVYSRSFELGQGDQLLKIAPSQLAAGTYLLHVETAAGRQVKTFTKQ